MIFIYLFLVALGFRCWALAFSSYDEWGLLSSCGVQATHCVASLVGGAQAQHLCMGLVAAWHVGSSQARD